MVAALHRHALTRLLSSVALLALAVGVVFTAPGYMRDRAARQVRSGNSRSTGSDVSLSATRAESYVPGVDSDPLSQTRTAAVIGSAPERQQHTLPPTLAALPDQTTVPAPRIGGAVPNALAFALLVGSLASSPSRGPPTF